MTALYVKTYHYFVGVGGPRCWCCKERKRKNRVVQARRAKHAEKAFVMKEIAREQ